MKPLFIVSAILTAISALISVYLFNAPIERSFIPHWAGPLISFVSLIILIGAERGPKPTVTEKGFWAILIGQPLLGIIIQLHYLSVRYETLSFFDSQLVPILAFHVFFACIGNYVTTAKSLIAGLPTPWNMRSQLSWQKSHRLIGFSFVILAIISAITTVSTGAFQERILGFGLLITLVVFAIYSWWVWRSDPDRQSLYGLNH